MSSDTHSAFVRHSSWMVIATFTGGIFMTLVHTVARKMGAEDYSTFVALLRLLIILGIPSAALQTVFAQQTAAAGDLEMHGQLKATTRAILLWIFLLWFIAAAVTLFARNPISHLLKIHNPFALYFTLLVALTSLWSPILKGLLQGRHQFAGLGWLMIIDGGGRFLLVLLLVWFLDGKAASTMFSAFAGQFVTVAIAAWLTRDIWRGDAPPFNWRAWLRGALPLTLGLGSILLMSSMDMVFVQGLFADTRATALYSGAMLTGYAMVQFIAPVAVVMFPRIVRSVNRGSPQEGLKLALVATGLFGALAAIGSTILPSLPLRMIYFSNREMWAAAPLVPWFAWALLPLTLANVLVQNVLARARFRAVPWLVLVPVVYALALLLQSPVLVRMPIEDAFVRIIQTLGIFCVALCAIAGWFSRSKRAVADPDSAMARATFDRPNSPAKRNISGGR